MTMEITKFKKRKLTQKVYNFVFAIRKNNKFAPLKNIARIPLVASNFLLNLVELSFEICKYV